jgi:hypothetical protein
MSADKLQTARNTLTEILSEPSSPPAFFDEEPAPQPLSRQPMSSRRSNPPIDAESAVAKQAKSLLTGLGLDTAIRLRWAMRDIRGKRTKMLPGSENDLAALVDLGLVEMQEGIPKLTDLGVLALD